MSRPPLTVVSPLPPSRSGIADYCAEQLPGLAREWRLTVVIADDAPPPTPVPHGVEVVSETRLRTDPQAGGGALRLYHLGNNPHHEHVLRLARERPGVVVLHDFVLHHLIRSRTLSRNDLAGYHHDLADDLGPGAADVLLRQEQLGLYTERVAHSFPLNRPLLSRALGAVVHSRASLERLRYHHPGLPVAWIPHHYSPPPLDVGDRAAARRELGVAAATRVVATLGFVTPAKQVDLLFAAAARLKDEVHDLELWVVGEAADERALAIAAHAHGVHHLLRYTGFVTTEAFYRFIAASDVIVNLRYPSAGETSGTLVRALGMGRCAIVFDYDSFADYPSGVVLKIPLDTTSPEPLAGALRRVLADPARREEIGAAAARHVREAHALDRCTASYSELLRELAGAAPAARRRPPFARQRLDRGRPSASRDEAAAAVERLIAAIDTTEFGDDAVAYARTHARRWAETLAAVPAAAPGMAALEIGSHQVVMPYLRHVAGYDYVAGTDRALDGRPRRLERHLCTDRGRERFDLFLFDAESDPFPFGDRAFDLVLVCEVIEHLGRDPLFLLSEVNRILRFDGVLVLTTPNVASARGVAAMLAGHAPYLYPNYNRDRSTDRHNIEYSPHGIAALLRAGGFGDLALRTPDCWGERPEGVMALLGEHGAPTELRGDVILATAVKVTEVVDRYPAEIYGSGPVVRRVSRWGPA